jgi:2'-5' RNA ligase
MNHRLFFALWPGESVRDRIDETAAAVARDHAPGGRRLRRDRLHLTLQFLGDFSPLPEAVTSAVVDAAARVVCDPFTLTLDHAGSFRGSRVWWLGSGECPAALQALHAALGVELAAAGVAVKAHPTFTPHVTIMRNVRTALPMTPVDAIDWPVDEFVLIDSQPERGYVELGRWPLRRR